MAEYFTTVSVAPRDAYNAALKRCTTCEGRDATAQELRAWADDDEPLPRDVCCRSLKLSECSIYQRPSRPASYDECEDLFDLLANRYRHRFCVDGVFGSIAVRTGTGALCSPCNNSETLSKRVAVDVLYPTEADLKQRCVRVIHHSVHEVYDDVNGEPFFDPVTNLKWVASGLPVPQPALNAVLLLRQLQRYPDAVAVLYLPEQLSSARTVSYTPLGTVQDNLREISGPVYNIEGRGFIAALTDIDKAQRFFRDW